MTTCILLKFLILRWHILRTIWRIEVSDGLFFLKFLTLFHLSLFYDRSFPLRMFENPSFWQQKLSAWFAYDQRNIFSEKYLGNRPFKKSHFIRVWPWNLHFYGSFKNCKINFFQNSPLGSTPSSLLTWLKNHDIIYLKINNKHKCFERFSPFLLFLGPVKVVQVVPFRFACLKPSTLE